MAKGYYLVKGDMTTCGAKFIPSRHERTYGG